MGQGEAKFTPKHTGFFWGGGSGEVGAPLRDPFSSLEHQPPQFLHGSMVDV